MDGLDDSPEGSRQLPDRQAAGGRRGCDGLVDFLISMSRKAIRTIMHYFPIETRLRVLGTLFQFL